MNSELIPTELLARYPEKSFAKREELPLSYKKIVVDFLDKFPKQLKGNILDVGSGIGLTNDLFHQAGLKPINLDLSIAAFQQTSFPKICGLADSLPIKDTSVTAIHAKDVLVHCPDKERLFNEFSRVLSPSGLMLITSSENKGNFFQHFLENPKETKMIFFSSSKEFVKKITETIELGKGKIGPPYFPTHKKETIKIAKRAGFKVLQSLSWQPSTEEMLTDWFGGVPQERFILLLQKKSKFWQH